MSLLDKAVAATRPHKIRHEFDEGELLELALAYFRGAVSNGAASLALYGHKNMTCTQTLGMALRRAVVSGKVAIVAGPSTNGGSPAMPAQPAIPDGEGER